MVIPDSTARFSDRVDDYVRYRPGYPSAVLDILRAYESLLERFGTDYRAVRHTNIDPEALRPMFEGGEFTRRVVYNEQRFDLDGVRGRLLSSSYTPMPAEPTYEPMLRELERIFEANAQGGEIRFEYDTELYFGHIAAE